MHKLIKALLWLPLLLWTNAGAQMIDRDTFCYVVADYALVARALALEPSLDRIKADQILGRIYRAQAQFNEELMSKVRGRARMPSELSAAKFAESIGSMCAASRGDPQFLGRDT